MPRLVTFGCSFVYGAGFSDCFFPAQKRGWGPKPSEFAWPKILASKLDVECVNLARPASGNFQIMMKVMQTEYRPDDIVIIAFSYFDRYPNYQMIDRTGEGTEICRLGPVHKAHILAELGDKHAEHRIFWNNWLAIQQCVLYLKAKEIKNLSYIGALGQEKYKAPDFLILDTFLPDMDIVDIDKSKDKSHPGEKSHAKQAELLYRELTR